MLASCIGGGFGGLFCLYQVLEVSGSTVLARRFRRGFGHAVLATDIRGCWGPAVLATYIGGG